MICFLLSLLGAGSITCCFAVGADEAKIAISQVEGDLGLAYVAVAEAAEAGADITDMLDKLVDAGVFLSAANNAFRIRDYTTAHELAERCGEAVAGIVTEAARLKAQAGTARDNRLLLAVLGSSVGLVLLIVFGFLGWRVFRKRYFKRTLDFKPKLEDTK